MFGTKKYIQEIAPTSTLVYQMRDAELRALQLRILEIYKDVQQFCDKHNLTVMMGYGSALGAVRHQGFIPWDDDIDVLMPRKDFDFFIKEFPKYYADKYDILYPQLNCKCHDLFGKVIDKHSIFKSIAATSNGNHGIFLDIFPVENLPNNLIKRRINRFLSLLITYISGSVSIYHNNSKIFRDFMKTRYDAYINYKIRKFIGFIFSFLTYRQWSLIYDSLVSCKKYSGYFHDPTGDYRWVGYHENILFPAIKTKFEGVDVYVPHKVHEYLISEFGPNYMDLPPVNKREKHYVVEFSLTRNKMTNKPVLLRITTVDTSLYNLLNGQLKFLNEHYDVVAVSNDTGKLSCVSEREGVRTIAVPMSRTISPFKDLVSLFKLICLFKRERPYIVHANTPKASLLGMIAAWLCRVPNRIYTVTGLRFETTEGIMRFILKTMERITCSCATKVIPEGDGVKATLRKERITGKPLHKILNGNINGVNLEYFDKNDSIMQAAAKIRQSPSDFIFIFVGRIVKDKGVNELVYAFDKLSKEQSHVRLLLLGRFEDKLDPISQVTRRIIDKNDKITFVGYQSDVRPFLAASDVAVLPSYREGFPNVILQAGAMGLPSIVTDISGCNEIIVNGQNGIIVPTRDAESLYDAMRSMSSDVQFTHTLACDARKMIAERFNQFDFWAAMLTEYRSLDYEQ